VKITNNKAIGSNWDDVRKEIFTPEEILESDLRVALMGEIIKARHEISNIYAHAINTLMQKQAMP